MSNHDFTPTAGHAKAQQSALLAVLTTTALPVQAQLAIGSAAAFLAECQRVLPDRPGAKQKRRVSA